MSDLERGMQEAVENLRREREGRPSLADERKFFEALEEFLGPQSERDQWRTNVREYHQEHHQDLETLKLLHQDLADIKWWLQRAGYFAVGLIIAYLLFH
jgi:hypothetical protein